MVCSEGVLLCSLLITCLFIVIHYCLHVLFFELHRVIPIEIQLICVLKCVFCQCCLLVTNSDTDRAQDSFKCRTALKYKIPVVSFDFLHKCMKEGRWVDPEPYYVVGETKSQLLHRGLISSTSKCVVRTKCYCSFVNFVLENCQ